MYLSPILSSGSVKNGADDNGLKSVRISVAFGAMHVPISVFSDRGMRGVFCS